MSLAEYYLKIHSNLFAVKEKHHGGVVIHTKFEYDTIDNEQQLVLGTADSEAFTVIDATQEFTIKNESIVVSDVDGIRIELTFFDGDPIPHPIWLIDR